MSGYSSQSRFTQPSDLPPLRPSAFEPDGHDQQRADYNKYLWCSQDDLLRQRDRQVEENLRMLHGQQWIVWSKLRGRYVNLADLMSDDERVWRHMPVLNRLLIWFIMLHARMTENPPVIGFVPGPDRIDAELAEIYDTVFKYLWRDVNMQEVLDRMVSWLIPSGRAFLKSRIDPSRGDPIPTQGPAMLSLLDQFGRPIHGDDGEAIQRQLDVPFGMDERGQFQPAMQLGDMGEGAEADDRYGPVPVPGIQPAQMNEGGLAIDVLTCLECRGEWGPSPWHEKSYHIQKSLLTPLQCWEAFGMELEPDVTADENESNGVFWRVLYGSGHFGANTRGQGRGEPAAGHQQFVTIYESWHRPGRLEGTQRTEESPGGRLLITTGGGKVVRDGVRPGAFRYVSPIRAFEFVRVPGRPQGTSPQEFMNGPVRTRNRLFAQKLAHATLMANPIRVLDRSQGLEEGQVPNTPGAEILADRSRSTAPPVEYITVTPLGGDVDQAAMQLRSEIDEMGRISGTEGEAPTGRASARLVQQLRMNADRPIAGTMRSMVVELGRLAEDWLVLIPLFMDREKLISVVGEDGVARVVAVEPYLFQQGTINAQPDVESMLPETRAERQERAKEFWSSGIWGDPRSAEARQMLLDVGRFPHMSTMSRPGGPDRSTAERNLGLLLQGTQAAEINLYPWMDYAIHRFVVERFLKSPQYEKQSPQVRTQLAAYWMKLRQAEGDLMLMERLRMQEIEGVAAGGQIEQQAALEIQAGEQMPAPTLAGGPESTTSPPGTPEAAA